MIDRRRQPTPATAKECLDRIPGRVLLDRFPAPMLAVDDNGWVAYVNPAYATMLGYDEASAFVGRSLSTLLCDQGGHSPSHFLGRAHTAARRFTWNHAEGYSISTIVSPPLLLRADDPILLVTVTDLTETMWNDGSNGHHDKRR